MTEIIFLVEEDYIDGGYTAKAIGEPIFTQADDLESLKELLRDSVQCHFMDEAKRPKLIRLHIAINLLTNLELVAEPH